MDNYDDIINLPHHESVKHIRMSKYARAAQFAPFAALTGHGDAIVETGREVDSKIILDEDVKITIDLNLQYLRSKIKEKNNVEIIYFIKDKYKMGGKYEIINGYINKINDLEKYLVIADVKIYFDDILNIEIK